MDWVLIFSVMWTVNGEPTPPNTWTNVDYSSKELCETAAAALIEEMERPLEDGVKTYVKAVCVQRK